MPPPNGNASPPASIPRLRIHTHAAAMRSGAANLLEMADAQFG